MTTPRTTRRRMLAGVLGSTALVLCAPALAGCTGEPGPPPGPDPLEPLADGAEADVALAEAVAAAHPDLAGGATALLADRREHAAALRAELRRVRPPVAGPSAAPSSGAEAPVPAPADAAAARDALVSAVQTAREDAAALVPTAPGHRAALLASIAACCATHQAVLP